MKECLNCKKEFEPKKRHGKFCCANCRVAYNRKHPKIENGINVVVSPTMQELFESIMAGIDAINTKNGLPPAQVHIITPKQAVALHNAENKDQITELKGIPISKLKEASSISEDEITDMARKTNIQAEINKIKAEKCPKERDTPMGRKSWQMDQQKRIQELKDKLDGI